MEPMHPTSDEDRITTAKNGRATAATGRPPGEEDPGFHTDELIIALQKVSKVEQKKPKHSNFTVSHSRKIDVMMLL